MTADFPVTPVAASFGDAAETGLTSLAELFRLHHAELARLALLLVRDQETAEDVVQDVFTRVHARAAPLRPDAALAYLRSAVLNGCRSVLRHRAIARRLGVGRAGLAGGRAANRWSGTAELLEWPGSGAGSPGAVQGSWHESAEHAAIRAEDRRQVLAALATLPARRREVLVLRYYLGLSEAEIARTLGISAGTVKSTAARGIAALARALGEES
ncbi:MAG TPA: sigma-70 family RNA polymerase sigma factor [Streptosporangiaceae bacterium]|jgi:RNA polymerase sigma factor (sigma-70 family)